MRTSIPGSRRILDDGLDLAPIVAEANMVGAVLLHGDGSLKWSVTDSQRDAVSSSLLDHLAHLVSSVACHYFTIDLHKTLDSYQH